MSIIVSVSWFYGSDETVRSPAKCWCITGHTGMSVVSSAHIDGAGEVLSAFTGTASSTWVWVTVSSGKDWGRPATCTWSSLRTVFSYASQFNRSLVEIAASADALDEMCFDA